MTLASIATRRPSAAPCLVLERGVCVNAWCVHCAMSFLFGCALKEFIATCTTLDPGMHEHVATSLTYTAMHAWSGHSQPFA
jgi:hypothetical protein